MRNKLVFYSAVILMLTGCLFFMGCFGDSNREHQISINSDPAKVAALRSQIKMDVSGAKGLGGGEGSEYNQSGSPYCSVYRSVSSSLLSEIPPVVKFLQDGTGSSVYESLPEYTSLASAAVYKIIPSPDDSVYIVWDIYEGDIPRFSNKPLKESYTYYTWDDGTITDEDGNIITEDDIPVVVTTGNIWRISKDGVLTWFNGDGGDWEGNNPAANFAWNLMAYENYNKVKNFQMDKDGNLYGYKFQEDYGNSEILKYNPTSEELTTISICQSNYPRFDVCGSYIFEENVRENEYFKVIPIENPSQSHFIPRAASRTIQFYDSINDLIILESTWGVETLYTADDIEKDLYTEFAYYSPFEADNIVTWKNPDDWADYTAFEGGFIRDGKVYALLTNSTGDGDFRIYELSYSAENHTYTPSNEYIDVTSYYNKLNFTESKMNSNYLFYIDDDSHLWKVDASTGEVTDLTPQNIKVTDFAANETDVYITGKKGSSSVSGKINIQSNEFIESQTTDTLTVMATVDF